MSHRGVTCQVILNNFIVQGHRDPWFAFGKGIFYKFLESIVKYLLAVEYFSGKSIEID